MNYIDLFAGAGGLSEGFIKKGFNPLAHIEMNEQAINTLKTRMCYHYLLRHKQIDIYHDYLMGNISREKLYSLVPKSILDSCICETITSQSLPNIFSKIDKLKGNSSIDIIIGGPPCQAYSLVGRSIKSAKDKIKLKNNEKVVDDPRNFLYQLYCDFLNKYKPKIFVFENVLGMLSAKNGEIFRDLKLLVNNVGYEVDAKVLQSNDFGVKQNRKRVIIVGWLKELNLVYPDLKKSVDNTSINDMFADLPSLEPGEFNNYYKDNFINSYLQKFNIRTKDDILTQHIVRPNINRDREIYRITIRKWNDGHQRLHYDELPECLKTHKNRKSFVDRYKVVEGDTSACHTMLAHIAKDGHYFIHPDLNQARSISVREAARIQSFPDNYFFEGSRTAAFIQIGNAVPPLMAMAIAEGVKKMLKNYSH